MSQKSSDKKLINVKYSKYEELTDSKQKLFSVCKPYLIPLEINPNDFMFHKHLKLPYSELYVEQFKNIDDLFNIKDVMIKVAVEARKDIQSYRKLEPQNGFQVHIPKIHVAPILGLTNQDIIEYIKMNKNDYEKLLAKDFRQTGAYKNNFFSNQLHRWQEQELKRRIKNTDYHGIFEYFLKLLNEPSTGWTESPFFQIIALNEFLSHNKANTTNLSLYEYSQQNFEKLYDILMSYDYNSYSYTKKLMNGLNKNNKIPLLIYSSKTPKKDRELINSLSQEQIFTIIENSDNLTSPTISVDTTIKNILESPNSESTISYYDLSKLLISLITESVLSAKYESHKDMFKHLSSSNNIILNTVNQFATDLSKTTKSKIYYGRIANVIEQIQPYISEMTTLQLTGFLFSFHSHYRKLVVSDADSEQYTHLIEKVIREKGPVAATNFFAMLGDLIMNDLPTPKLIEWEDYIELEEDFSIPCSFIIKMITSEEEIIDRDYITNDFNKIRSIFSASS